MGVRPRTVSLALAMLVIAVASGCRDGTTTALKTPPIFPGPVPVGTGLAQLDLATAVTRSSAFVRPVAVVAVPKFLGLGRDEGNKPGELIEGALFLVDVTSTAGAGSGVVREVLDESTGPAVVTTYAAIGDAAPAAVAIDAFESRGRSGRVWVAAGRSVRAFVGGGSGPGAQTARFDLGTDLVPAGESLTAMTAAAGQLQLFLASQSRVLLLDTAGSAQASTVTAYMDFSALSARPISGLAAGADGALFIAAGTTSPSFFRIPQALYATAPTGAAQPLALSVTALAGITVNGAGNLVAADAAQGLLLEAGVSVTALPSGAAVLGPVYADPFVARVLVVDLSGAPTSSAVLALEDAHLAGGVQPILSNRCVECHNASITLGGLDLSSGATFASTRSIRACETFASPPPGCPPLPTEALAATGTSTPPGALCPDCPFPQPLSRAEPGLSSRSYVILKVAAVPAPVPGDVCSPSVCGERMPPAAVLPRALLNAEVQILRAWIDDGAQDD